MNSNPSSPERGTDPSSTFRPYVSPETEMTESTIGAIVLGSILGIMFAAASVYAGLKVGLTTSASIPIAVLSITILRAFGKSTILKNNIVQTTGSAGESMAAGVAFTLPSLLLMGFDIDTLRITLVALLGGALGILMMIPLRHSLMVKEHGKLLYPEGTACAQVLIVGERGGASAAALFGGLFLGGLWALLGRIGKFFAEYATWGLDKIVWNNKTFSFLKGGSISFETNPVLLGTGYIIGWRTSFIMLAGGILSFLVFIPAIQYFGPELTSPLVGGGLVKARDMSPNELRNAFVLYIGAGAVAAGGLISLARALPTIFGAFFRGIAGFGGKGATMPLRTARDLPMSVVIFGSLALIGAIWAPHVAFTKGLIERNILGIDWLSAILIILFGFFFVTVSSRITGEIGSSSNPISGMTVATLLITCLLFVAAGRTGVSYKEMALCTAALVCVAASNGGTTSQDLKTGFLVGATPRKQQIAIMWGVLTSSAVIGFTLMYLNDSYSTLHKRDFPGFTVTHEAVAKLAAAGNHDLEFGAIEEHRNQQLQVLYVRVDQMDPAAPAGSPRVLVSVGKYLTKGDRIAYRVDPGILGSETEEFDDSGKLIRKIDGKFDAPQARLFSIIINGVLGGSLPWVLVLIGVFIAIMMEFCGVAALPFAVGAYLPMATSASIFIGGLARKWADRKVMRTQTEAERKRAETEQESSPGVLFSSGLIAGGALAGILICALSGPTTITERDGKPLATPIDSTYGKKYELDSLSHRVFTETETVGDFLHTLKADAAPSWLIDNSTRRMPIRDFLDQHNWWGLGCFLVLALFLYVVATQRKKPAPPAT